MLIDDDEDELEDELDDELEDELDDELEDELDDGEYIVTEPVCLGGKKNESNNI